MQLIVQKFGGTSVGDDTRRRQVANKIKNEIDRGNRVVVIVSAMGRSPLPYATDTLLSLPYDDIISQRDTDMLMSCGEVISSVVMASLLCSIDIEACALNALQAGIKTTGEHTDAKCIGIDNKYIMELLSQDIVPVIAGFQGIYNDIETTTLGRGGSDTSAALIAGAIGADRIDIYTDVDGIMTADPRIIDSARVIDEIHSEEVYQMADAGAKVIHPRAVDAAKTNGIDMHIKNTASNHIGTKITPNVSEIPQKNLKVVIAVTSMSNRTQVRIAKVKEYKESKILNKLAENKISIDLINIFRTYMVFTINSADVVMAKKIFEKDRLKYTMHHELSKVTVIGSNMRGVPGVTAKIVSALLDIGCEILQTADSHINISCLVESKYNDAAIEALHSAFGLEQ